MTSLDEPFSKVCVEEGGAVTLHLKYAKGLKNRCPEIYDALIECAAFVNFRRIEIGQTPVLFLAFYN